MDSEAELLDYGGPDLPFTTRTQYTWPGAIKPSLPGW
jgi:hypothetical protein